MKIHEKPYTAAVAEIEAVKDSIMPTVSPLGVTGAMPGATLIISTNTYSSGVINGFYGRILGLTVAGDLYIPEDANPVNANTLTTLQMKLVGSDMQSIYLAPTNKIPWHLVIDDAWRGGDFFLTAQGANLSQVDIFPYDGLGGTLTWGSLDLSDNPLITECITALSAQLSTFTLDQSIALDISGAQAAIPSTEAQGYLDIMRSRMWAISQNYAQTLHVAHDGADDIDLAGNYDRVADLEGYPRWKHTAQDLWIFPRTGGGGAGVCFYLAPVDAPGPGWSPYAISGVGLASVWTVYPPVAGSITVEIL